MPSPASVMHQARHSYVCSSALPLLLLLLLLLCQLPQFVTAFLPSLPFTPLERSHTAKQTATSHTIPLSGGLLHTSGFYFHALIGGHNLSLQVDTSYASLIVPRLGCVGCRVGDSRYDPDKSKKAVAVPCGDDRCVPKTPGQCDPEHCFNCAKSGNCCVEGKDECAFNMFYGDGTSGNGTMYEDELSVQGLQAKVLLGAMHEESHNFELPYADGVFGLAFQHGACNPACVPPLMDLLVSSSGMANVFTMCVAPFGGTLVLGKADASLATRPFQYVGLADIASEDRFVVPAQSEWGVGARRVQVPAVTAAMWSAGTSNIAVAKSTFLALLGHMTDHYCHIDGLCSMTSWFRPQRCSIIPDASVKQMPNITMGLSAGVSITLTPEDYLIKYRIINGEQQRCVAFIATDSLAQKGIGLLLGTTVMRRYAVAYDRAEKKVGLAPARAGVCGPETGSERGLPSRGHGENVPVLTADAPAAEGVDAVGKDTEVGKRLLEAEQCRAEETCSGCAAMRNCSFGYQSGQCVPVAEGGRRPYPWCSGGLCVCFATGGKGWYVGVVIGVLVVAGVGGGILLLWRKRARRNPYAMVQSYEEQDLETF